MSLKGHPWVTPLQSPVLRIGVRKASLFRGQQACPPPHQPAGQCPAGITDLLWGRSGHQRGSLVAASSFAPPPKLNSL